MLFTEENQDKATVHTSLFTKGWPLMTGVAGNGPPPQKPVRLPPTSPSHSFTSTYYCSITQNPELILCRTKAKGAFPGNSGKIYKNENWSGRKLGGFVCGWTRCTCVFTWRGLCLFSDTRRVEAVRKFFMFWAKTRNTLYVRLKLMLMLMPDLIKDIDLASKLTIYEILPQWYQSLN